MTGGTCIDPALQLGWRTPDAGARFNVTTIAGSVQVTRPDGGASQVLRLPVRAVGGATVQFEVDGGLASGTLGLAVESAQTFIAGWEDGGPLTSLTVTRDTMGPTFTTNLLPSGYQQRDDLLVVLLTASEAVQLTSVDLRAGGVRMNQSDAGCAANAGCWEVNLSLPPLDGIDGGFLVTATGNDLAGNPGASMLGSILVTRKRWEVQPTTEAIRAAPAVGFDGTLFVGASNATGVLYALHPADGGIRGPAAALGAIQSVATAVSNAVDTLYYSTNDGVGGKVGALRADTLALGGFQLPVAGNNQGFTSSAVGLLALTINEVGAVATFNQRVVSSASRVVVYGPTSSVSGVNATDGGPTFDFAGVPSPPYQSANNIIVNGATNEAWLLTSPPGAGLHWNVIGNINGSPTVGVRQQLEMAGNDCCLGGQAVASGAALIAGSTAGARKFYLVAGTAPTSGTLTAAVDNGVPAVGVGSAFAGRGNDFVRFDPQQLNTAGTPLLTGTTLVRTSPVLGRARAGQSAGLGYAVTSSGTLVVFAQDGAANSATDWGSLFATGSNAIYAHPTLDCNRRAGAATSTTGILYVAAGTGRVVAVVVDSPALLDTAGAWPKYQRTAGNAGNTDSRFPFNPGCP